MIELGVPDGPLVLVVDDELRVVESVADLLRKDCLVLGTTDPGEALASIQARPIALVLADQRMPGMTGAELLARAFELRPDAIRMLFTGYSDIEAVIQAVNDGHIAHYVTKPWDAERLRATVKQGLAAYQFGQDARLRFEQAFAQLRGLQEVIPICLGCGRIKTGAARWDDVVEYLKRNSQFLSHGYCPPCSEAVREQLGLRKA
jgi:response regulator RpfG family c-di-GMP phosphodiesterase